MLLELFLLAIIMYGCSNESDSINDYIDDELPDTGRDYILLSELEVSWTDCQWEELVEYIDVNGNYVKEINRYKSEIVSYDYDKILCNLYLNDIKIDDFLLMVSNCNSISSDHSTPLSVYLRHLPTNRDIEIYSFDNWNHIYEIVYSIVKTNRSSDNITEIKCRENASEYICIDDCDYGYDTYGSFYIGFGYRTQQGYLRCGLIGDLCGEYPRLHLVSDDAPQNVRYNLLGIFYDWKYSQYLNPDYDALTEDAEYAVAPDESWPDMRDTSHALWR